MQKKAIFFDRDGVVNYRIVGDYVKSVGDFKILPDVFDFFKKIKNNDYLAILVTNQQGIGKGLMTEKDLAIVHNEMQEIFKERTGYVFDEIYYCPELKSAQSFRRKPNPGMLIEAMSKWNIDYKKCYMIGDRKSDILAGKHAGVKTILIGNDLNAKEINPDFHYLNFYELLPFLD